MIRHRDSFCKVTPLPMSFLSLLFLALLQGLTEFLPVSSSAHLKLFHLATGTEANALVLDVAVHIGTMAAVCLYFWRDVLLTLRGIADVLCGRLRTEGAQLFLLLSLATIPAIIVGLALKLSGLAEKLDLLWLMGSTMIIFGIILYWADKRAPQTRTSWTWRDALIMGLWQAVALVPGVSRSGATITAARFLGFERISAARLAMLMSIPTILASGSLLAVDVVKEGDWSLAGDAAIAAFIAFLAALLALRVMMTLLARVSFTPYVIYRILLGIVLLIIAAR